MPIARLRIRSMSPRGRLPGDCPRSRSLASVAKDHPGHLITSDAPSPVVKLRCDRREHAAARRHRRNREQAHIGFQCAKDAR